MIKDEILVKGLEEIIANPPDTVAFLLSDINLLLKKYHNTPRWGYCASGEAGEAD